METTPLRRFLQSLCDNSCWNYAVFWKLQHQTQTLLIWGDGYFGTLKVQNSIKNMFAETSFGGFEETSSCNTYNGSLGGDAVELAVAYMSTFQYALGDGDVGDVAHTGNCRWLFAGSKSGEINTTSILEHADEWVIQFAAGVKTILLVPVIPYGVLQLGSLEDLAEDAQMANYISDEFFAHQDFMGYSDSFATNQQFSSQSPSSLIPSMIRSFDEFPSFMTSIDDINWSSHKQLTKNLVTPTSDSWYSSHLTGTDAHTPSVIHSSEPLHQLTNLINSDSIESSKSSMSVLASQPLVSDVGSFLCFPRECELHKALVPAFMEKADDSTRHLSIGDDDDMYSFSNHISRKYFNASSDKIDGMRFCKEDVQNTVRNVHTGGESLLDNSFAQFTSLPKWKNINERSATEGESSLFSNHVVPASFIRLKSHNDSSSPSGISYEGVVNEVTEEDEQKTKYNNLHQSKGSKPSGASKKRAKPGAKQKTRPRDRQLIQDRLKDLRELVPNGEKCSIDGLLDRTVKHMLFLKSIGDRAIKLRQCIQPEGVGSGSKNNKKPEEKFSQNGASWAVEIGGDMSVCPIHVEDLQCPGHMVIEMICNESFRFLEIAEVIHGLRLTILNGVMKKRSGNTWACYIVEAPQGFHRLDIFWPLMKLLEQQQQSPISSKI